MSVALLTALVLSQAGPLPATLAERFYNRPGASTAARDADLARCLAIATEPMGGIGPAVVKDRRLTPPISTEPDRSPAATRSDDPIETCMSNRGWRLYALTPRERAAWAKLSAPASPTRLPARRHHAGNISSAQHRACDLTGEAKNSSGKGMRDRHGPRAAQ